MNPNHFFRLKTLVAFEIGRFDKALIKLHAAQYPSAVAHDFIEYLRGELESQRTAMAEILQDFPEDPIGAVSRLKSEHRKLQDKLQFLDAIENARIDEVPWSLIPTIERYGSKLLSGRRILTTATTDVNYAIRWYRSPSEGVGSFFTLYTPKVHRANAFLHILFGHELFHPILDEFFDQHTAVVAPTLREGCKRLLSAAGAATDLFAPQRLGELVELSLSVWRRGLEELMCDLGCASVFGPAALLSASSLALSENLDEPPAPDQFYPPWRLRMRIMLQHSIDTNAGAAALAHAETQLKREGLQSEWQRLAEAVADIRSLTLDQTDVQNINVNPLLKLAYEAVNGSISDAREYVQRKAAVLDDRWTETIQQVPSLLRCLETLIPPGELRNPGARIGQPASSSAIALAGWVYQLRHERPGSNSSDVASFKRTCRLMLKAFEDAELKRRFAETKSDES